MRPRLSFAGIILLASMSEQLLPDLSAGRNLSGASQPAGPVLALACKRLADIVLASVVLVLSLPLFLVVAVLIRCESRGGASFVQLRLGRDGSLFPCFKFRTMHADAEAMLERWATDQPELLARYRSSNFKLADDPRVTGMGYWLRRTSLDELPQLVNVLRGEMSLVGPRPLLPREIPDYGPAIALYHRMRPGLTGLWQISGRSSTTFAQRAQYDVQYIQGWSLWRDFVILARTPAVLFAPGNSAL